MLIKVYDKTGKLIDEQSFYGTLLDFIKKEAGEHYDKNITPPYSAKLNGVDLPYENHDSYFSENDLIEITIEPEYEIVYLIIYLVIAAYAYYVSSNIDTGYSSTERGESIYLSDVRANKARPNQIIREVAGSIPIYPDYITPPRRRYENNNEFIYTMLSVGVGYFSISSENIYISETPISYYSGNIELEIFDPGDDVSGNVSYENWYTIPDVSNLELKSTVESPIGSYSAVFDSSGTIQSFLNGSPTAFPFDVDEIFYISEAQNSLNDQLYRVDSLSTTSASDDTANVTVMQELGPGIYTELSGGAVNTDSIGDVTWESVTGGVNWEGPFILCPQNEVCDEFEFDVLFPQGLFRITGGGSQVETSVSIEVQYRDSSVGGVWSTVSATSWTENTRNQIGYTVVQSLGSSYNPEVRFRRVTGDATSTQISNSISLVRVKSRLSTVSSYDDVTTIALKIRSTRGLANTAENRISIRGSKRKLPTISEIKSFIEDGTPYDITSSNTGQTNFYDISNMHYLFGEDSIASYIYFGNMFFSDNGMYVYVVRLILGIPLRFRIVSYPLSSAFDISSIVNSPSESNNLNTDQSFTQIFDSGSKILAVETATGQVRVFNLSVPYDITTLSTSPDDVFDDSGFGDKWAKIYDSKLFVLNSSGILREYSLSSSNDISGAIIDSNNNEYDFSGYGIPHEFLITENRLFIISGESSQEIYIIYEFNISNYSLENVVYTGNSFDFSSGENAFDFDNIGRLVSFSSGIDAFSVYNTTTYTDSRETSSIPRFFAYMLNDRLGNNLSGYIDWDAIENFESVVDFRLDKLNAEFSKQSTIWESSKLILSTGYAEPTVKDGKITIVRTASGSDYSHLYTPDVMISGVSTRTQHDRAEEPDGIVVEYLNDRTGITETVNAFLPSDQGVSPKRISAFGITDRARAWRFGMRERERERNKPEEYKFSTEMDALNSYYGDAIGIVDELDSPNFGKVTDVFGSTITTDQELIFQGSDIAFFRDDEGLSYGPFQVSSTSNTNQMELTSPASLGFTPGQYDVYFSMGTVDQVVKRAIVRSIQPNEDKTCEVIAEEYIADIYQHDNLEP